MSDITAAPQPISISEKELSAHPFTEKEFAELTNWVRYQIIQTARSAIRNMSDVLPSEREEILQAAIKSAASSTWDTRDGRQICMSVDGLQHIGWMMVRKSHPFKKEEFSKLVGSEPDNYIEIDRAFWELNFPDALVKTTEVGTKGADDSKK